MRHFLAIVVLLGVLVAACGDDAPPSVTTTPAGTPVATTTAASGSNCEATDDVCFTRDQMQAAYDRTIGFVTPYIAAQYRSPPRVAGYIYIQSGQVANSACGPLASDSFLYCGGDAKIYLGQDAMWRLYSERSGGDAGLALALAHEYGHHLQAVAGVPAAQTDREKIPRENQADCVAGAWMKWAREQGYMRPGEAAEIAATLKTIASIVGEKRDHGTLEERSEAVSLGLGGKGLYACNDYFSRTPLITA